MIKPSRLRKGDTIGIIAPSGGLSGLVPHRLDNAIKFFKSKGYKVKEFPTARRNNGWESAPAKERARDIMDAFLDKKVKAIICTIGGNTANKTLKYLDFEKIKENPKIFSGYSDASILHYAFNKKAEIVTFYGPAAMTQFGEYPKPLDYTWNHFLKAVSEGNIGKIEPSKEWTDEILDWFAKKDLEISRNLKANKGFEWLKEGSAEGDIIGGCLHSILHLIKGEYWPEHKDKILFIETPEGEDFRKGEPLAEIDAQLADLENFGILKEIKGLIIGRPFGYIDDEKEKFRKIVLSYIEKYNFPVLYNVDVGHTDPQITVPLGIKVRLDSKNNRFEFLESSII